MPTLLSIEQKREFNLHHSGSRKASSLRVRQQDLELWICSFNDFQRVFAHHSNSSNSSVLSGSTVSPKLNYRSRKSFLLHKGVPSHQAIHRMIPDATAFGGGRQHKGCIVRSPLPCRGTLAPLRARVQRLHTNQWKGRAAIHPLPCFFSLPGVPELMPWRQVSRIWSPPRLSALFCI